MEPNFRSADSPESISDVGTTRLDMLVADFAAHVERLSALDVSSVTGSDVAIELRDNAYPSLLILAEELRELDAEFSELSVPDVALSPEHALALAAALRSGQNLAAAVRAAMTDVSSEETRVNLETHASNVETTSRIATAVLHQLVIVDDEPTQANPVES